MIPLPTWVDKEAWDGYVEMRTAIKKPLTVRAAQMILKQLYELHDKGHDVNAALDQSTAYCWRSVWPSKERIIERVPETAQQYVERSRAEAQAERARASPCPPDVLERLKVIRRVA